MIDEWENEEKTERNREIVNLYAAGMTGEEIGHLFGVSAQRVRQILSKTAPPSTLRNSEAQSLRHSKQWEAIDPTDPRFRYGGRNRHLSTWLAHERNKAKRREHLGVIRQWIQATGRTNPSGKELADLLGYASAPSAWVTIAALWGRPTYGDTRRDQTYARYVERFRKFAGITKAPVGRPPGPRG